MDWQTSVLNAVRRPCRRNNDPVFTRKMLIDEELDNIVRDTYSKGATPAQTLSYELQELRDLGYIEFLDGCGTYRLNK